MLLRPIGAVVGVILLAALLPAAGAVAQDVSRYPDWKGQWERIGDARWECPPSRISRHPIFAISSGLRTEANIDARPPLWEASP
jgi:hypothetical protein